MKKKKEPRLLTEPVPIDDVSGHLPFLHYELGTGTTEDGRKIRFLQHINHGCFWLCVGEGKKGEMYQVNTEDLMNAIAKAVIK